jgi:dTDP-4-dehydrorhamnose reductase
MVHISTDFVFDGKADKPYHPDNPVSPLSVYGQSKAEGESRVLQACSRAVVMRTSWLYSQWGSNFVKTMLRLGAERPSLGVVSDQQGSPTWARDLAQALLLFLSEPLNGDDFGVYHYANAGITTWHGLASAVMAQAALPCTVNPITTADYPTPARRPAWSVLDTSRIQDRFGLAIPGWQDSLKDCLTLLLNSESYAPKN